jgi:hypothetical protein
MDPQKKKYFFFPKPHLNHLLYLLYFVISILKKYVNTLFPQKSKIPSEFLQIYIYNLSDFFSIIPYFILKHRTKGKKDINDSNSERNTKNGTEYIYTDIEDTHQYPYKKILILTISDYIAQISFVIFYIILNELDIPMKFAKFNSYFIVNVIVIFIISKLILNNQIYRHHSFSLLINIICLFVLIIVDIINIINYSGKIIIQFIYIILKIKRCILYSLEDVLIKVLILKYYFHPFRILFIKAILDLFYNIIFNFPFIFIKLRDKDDERELLFHMIGRIFEDKINILITFILAGISFIYNSTIFKIIDEFSPNHFAIASVIENFGILMLNIILEGAGSQKNLILDLIIYIILIFAALVYNEFLIINILSFKNIIFMLIKFHSLSRKIIK